MVTSAEILKAKILIVDDQEPMAWALQSILEDAGYTDVSSTTNPCEVSELYRVNRYDLVLLDIQMPVMSGFGVMKELKAFEGDGYVPVIALTAQPSYKVPALKAGAKDFVLKPFDLEEVLMRVHNMLEVRLLHEEARNNAKLLESLALHDPLTGLANRRLLAERIWMAMANARRNKTEMALLYLDLDGFKQVNDTLGHAYGDLLLKSIAARLVDSVREEDTVARLGGDEFMIALWHVGSADDVSAVALKLVHSVSQPYPIDGHTVNITTSAGVSIYPAHGKDADTLMKSADAALYQAKRAGKNAYRIAQCELVS